MHLQSIAMNTTDQISSPISQDQAMLPVIRLRELLNNPAPKADEWQDEAGRMASLLAVQFPQESDEAKALSIVALIGLAAASGVKEAKKKSLKLTRWSKAPPLPLQALLHLDEQHAVVLALSKVHFSWAPTYIEQALENPELASELLPELLRWARAVSPDWVSFVVKTYAGALASCTGSGRAVAMLKDASKLLRVPIATSIEKVAAALSTLIRAIISSASRFAEDEKASLTLLLAGYSVFEKAWQANPALLFQPALISVLPQMTLALKTLKKQPPASVNDAALATLSLVGESVRLFGAVAVEQYRLMVPMWLAAYPDFPKHLKLAAGVEPALGGLISSASVTEEVASDQIYSAESAFASLLPAWDAFVAGLSDPDQVSSLTLMINRAAGTVNVERHGVVGETVAYDPLSHHLANPGQQTPTHVTVLRAGVQVRRIDGSQRTLVKTLVAATAA
jgi:hypothetical protein